MRDPVRSSILIIGGADESSPAASTLSNLGVDFAKDTQSVRFWDYPVIAFISEKNFEQKAGDFLEKVLKNAPKSEYIFITPDVPLTVFKRLFQHGKKLRISQTLSDAHLVNQIQEALAENLSTIQQENLHKIASRHQEQLQSENVELQSLIESGTKNIDHAKKRVSTVHKQNEALHRALIAVHKAESTPTMEAMLYAALKDLLDLAWVRIFFQEAQFVTTQLERLNQARVYTSPLSLGQKNLGTIAFARNKKKDFSRSEEEALQQIAESVSLALDRLSKLDQAENLKTQWDATFDSISEPLCITNEKFQIVRTNNAFLSVTKKKSAQVNGTNCFATFCGSENVAPLAPSPTAIVIQRSGKRGEEPRFYEVTTQRIKPHADEQGILLLMFRDVTEQKKIEKQIFESSKMAELGTIGSSIAHDINNPLGGMISFLQLIKMDLKKDDPIYADIVSMEAAGKRCKDIVENLLRFSRKQDPSEMVEVDLREVVQQAIQLVELQTRAQGIQVEVQAQDGPINILGHFNLLAQALSHVIQNAVEAVSEKLKTSPRATASIRIELKNEKTGPFVNVIDSGSGISAEVQNKIFNPMFSTKAENRGLGLTLAYRIVDDHHGRLEIFSQPNIGTTVKIAFPNV